MHEKDLSQIINNLDKIKATRREALLWLGGTTTLGTISILSIADIVRTEGEMDTIEQTVDANFPIPEEVARESQDYTEKLQESMDALQQDDLSGARSIINSAELEQERLSFLEKKSIEEKREQEKNERISKITTISHHSPVLTTAGAAVGFQGFIALAGIIIKTKNLFESRRHAKDHLQALIDFYKPENTEQLVAYNESVSLLPPVGGKIPLVMKDGIEDKRTRTLPVFLSAEARAIKILDLRRRGKLGESYVDQLTVQGRHPDSFKRAAIALILNNPYSSNWEEPFFGPDAWGALGPLIHGGGNLDTSINSRWRNHHGRTDFLEKVFHVSIQGQAIHPSDQSTNTLEEDRLVLESMFYQRAAFANDCFEDSLPYKGNNSQKIQGAAVWENFSQKLDRVLKRYKIERAAQVPWFLDKPRTDSLLADYGHRYEADAWPIQQALNEVEKVRPHCPELRQISTALMYEVVSDVNRIIGLPEISFYI